MPDSGVHRDEERGRREERLRFLFVLLAAIALSVALVVERVQSV
jgi:hypothetical protein